jgi:hypothetical protein
MKIEITWVRCLTYEDAQDFTGVIYLHEWNGQPFYWGKAEISHFGGNTRKNLQGKKVSARYSSGYSHWIKGCLQHGAKLYFGLLEENHKVHINDVENFLIKKYRTPNNKKSKVSNDVFTHISHKGTVPECITHSR